MTFPDPVIALMLLASCNLADDKAQLFMSALSNVSFKEKKSTASITFSNGLAVKFLKRLVLPCSIGGKRCTLETDVAKCSVPLLLSEPSIKKCKMRLYFERNVGVTGGKIIFLDSTASGHYLLPLKM